MENLLCATVLEHQDLSTAQLVVVAMSRAVGPFPSSDALLAWSGGPTLFYAELQLCFPHAAAIGISTRIRMAAIRPFPFADGSTVKTMCVVAPVSSNPPLHAVESVVVGVREAGVLVRVLSDDNAALPMLCLEGTTPEQFPRMLRSRCPLSSPSAASHGQRFKDVRRCNRCASRTYRCLSAFVTTLSLSAPDSPAWTSLTSAFSAASDEARSKIVSHFSPPASWTCLCSRVLALALSSGVGTSPM